MVGQMLLCFAAGVKEARHAGNSKVTDITDRKISAGNSCMLDYCSTSADCLEQTTSNTATGEAAYWSAVYSIA